MTPSALVPLSVKQSSRIQTRISTLDLFLFKNKHYRKPSILFIWWMEGIVNSFSSINQVLFPVGFGSQSYEAVGQQSQESLLLWRSRKEAHGMWEQNESCPSPRQFPTREMLTCSCTLSFIHTIHRNKDSTRSKELSINFMSCLLLGAQKAPGADRFSLGHWVWGTNWASSIPGKSSGENVRAGE